MAVTLEQLMHPSVVIKSVSAIRKPMNRLSRFYGMGIGGRNTAQYAGKNFSWDQFNTTRALASVRPGGTGPARQAPTPVGNVSARAVRAHDAVGIIAEKVFVNRPIGGSLTEVDTNGARYVQKLTENLGQTFWNLREFMISRVLRGSGFQVLVQGDTCTPVDSGGTFSVSFNTPAGNIGTCGGIFAGNWTTPASAVPHAELLNLNAAAEAGSGFPIRHAWCNGATFATLLKIDEVRNLAGTANAPFAAYESVGDVGDDGRGTTDFVAQLRGIPWLTWHITDSPLTVNGTDTKPFPNGRVAFTPDPDSEWMEMREGSEIIRQDLGDRGFKQVQGFDAWWTPTIDPAGWELKAMDICLPALYLPNAIFYATVY